MVVLRSDGHPKELIMTEVSGYSSPKTSFCSSVSLGTSGVTLRIAFVGSWYKKRWYK